MTMMRPTTTPQDRTALSRGLNKKTLDNEKLCLEAEEKLVGSSSFNDGCSYLSGNLVGSSSFLNLHVAFYSHKIPSRACVEGFIVVVCAVAMKFSKNRQTPQR